MRIFFCAFTSLLLAASPKAEESKPNILFIMVDDLGYGDLSCYGAPDLKSPNIDQLFASGMRFDQFYANCPVCSPTRAAFLTGLYPDNAGVPGVIRTPLAGQAPNWGNLRNDVKTFPAHMKEGGYETAIFGKWHLGLEKPDRPNDVGFDHFQGFLGDMMDSYYTHLRHGINYMRHNGETIDPEGHATDLFTQWAIDFLKGRRANPKPFFAYLAYNAPHTPIQPPKEWIEKVKARESGISDKRARLVALIEHLDAGVGRVLDTLEAEGLSKDTIVVFTSDNGGQVDAGARNAPLHGGKQDMWEGGIRVGTCVSWPDRIKAGEVIKDHISMTMDFYPTLAELAGHPATHPMDGRSFAPILRGEDWREPRRDLYWVRLEGNQKYGGIPYHAVRNGQWKLLRNTGFEPYQLFNLENDPEEKEPVPRNEEPGVYNKLFNSLLIHINHAGKRPWQRENP